LLVKEAVQIYEDSFFNKFRLLEGKIH
jgi:hypothetical protein